MMWREKRSWGCVTATIASIKVLRSPQPFNWKCGDYKQAGITEIMWPGGGNPQTAVSVIFLHLPAHPGLQAKAYLLQIIHLQKKKNLLPRNERVACLSDSTPGEMISALMKTSEGLISSTAKCVSRPTSVLFSLV